MKAVTMFTLLVVTLFLSQTLAAPTTPVSANWPPLENGSCYDYAGLFVTSFVRFIMDIVNLNTELWLEHLIHSFFVQIFLIFTCVVELIQFLTPELEQQINNFIQ